MHICTHARTQAHAHTRIHTHHTCPLQPVSWAHIPAQRKGDSWQWEVICSIDHAVSVWLQSGKWQANTTDVNPLMWGTGWNTRDSLIKHWLYGKMTIYLVVVLQWGGGGRRKIFHNVSHMRLYNLLLENILWKHQQLDCTVSNCFISALMVQH